MNKLAASADVTVADVTATNPAAELTYFVDGMDCASCVQKVERMVDKLAGTGDVKTSFNKQTLRLSLDETQTSRQTLESHLKALGYTPTLRQTVTMASATASAAASVRPALVNINTEEHTKDDHAHADHDHTGHTHEIAPAGMLWYNTGQGKLVVFSGILLALAWGFSFIAPQLSVYGYVAATLIGVWPLLKKAVASARFGDPFSINMLVALAAIGAVLIGQAAEGAVVVFLFAVGELLEGVAAGRARAGIQALAALTPKTALFVQGEKIQEVPANSLKVGQVVQINAGARVPADGTILAGTSSLDDSPVTGESVPVSKTVGETVYAGSINTDGVLRIRVDKSAADNTIARIIHLVEEAESSKSQTARFIDRFSRYYTPAVVLISALVAVIPPLLFAGDWYSWIYKAISLLLIGCPCALVLSVPAAITSAISAGTRQGLLIKGGAALEAIGTVKTIAFDKTGTLTEGKPKVTDSIMATSIMATGIMATEMSQLELARLAAAVESGSSHPLAKAITDWAVAQKINVPAATEAKANAGKGVSANVEGRPLFVSSPAFATTQVAISPVLQQQVITLENEGKTVVVLHDQQSVLGIIGIRDEPREDAKTALAKLHTMGIKTLMLTGDNARTGKAIAAGLGLEVQADLMPEAKLRIIEQLKQHGGVAMVGDGINDAPALAMSDVGVAMGGGTDVALETADVALLQRRVWGVVDLVELSRDTMTNIKWNIVFALGLKAIFLVTTLLGYTNLWMAILADTGATALVTANALRLLGWKSKNTLHGGQKVNLSSI